MAEGLYLSREDEEPKTPETSDEEDEEDTTKGKSGSKKSVGRAGIGGLFKSAESVNASPKQLKGFDRLFDAFKVDAKTEKSEARAEHRESQAEPTEVASENVPPEVVETYELPRDSIGGGEFIVDLRSGGEVPAETAEIPLNQDHQELAENQNEVEDDSGVEAIPGENALEETAESDPSEEADQDDATVRVQSTPWQQQPQQQHQAQAGHRRTSAGSPPPPPPPSPPTPPPTPPSGYQAAYAQAMPHSVHHMHNAAPPNPNAPSAINPNTQPNQAAVAADAEYYGRRQGRREGLFAGLLIGGGVEHIRHRRRERRMEKRHNEVVKKQEKLAEDTKWDRIREKESDTARAEFAAQFDRPQHSAESIKLPEQGAFVVAGKLKAEAAVQRIKHEMTRETVKIERAAEIEHDRKRESLEVPDGHRVERSAWHSVELDERGRPVENSAVQYGQEYYRERAHEATPIDKKALKSVAAGAAMAGTASAARSDTSLDSGGHHAVSQDSQGIVTKEQAKKALKAVSTPPTTQMGTIVWGIVLLVLLTILYSVVF